MRLIKALTGAACGILANQWRKYFYCEAMPPEVLVSKGMKRVSDRSSNISAKDNIITNGSIIAVNNQCMIIVEQGKVVDLCTKPGEYTYDKSTEPSVLGSEL